MTPDPGATRFISSSKTTVVPSTETVGPLFMVVSPLVTVAMPLLPDSDDPMASMMAMLGRWLKNSSLTGEENRAAEEVTANREERS